jgi:ribosomal protein S18 acetylase RimI-like enzyme
MRDVLGKTVRIARLEGEVPRHTFREIEVLHRAQLVAGALAHMPDGFLANFYRYLVTRADCVVLIAEKEGRLAGFAAGALHASSLLKSFVLSEPLEMAGYCIRLLLDPRLLYRILSLALNLATNTQHSNMDERQLLSIAVDPLVGRSGVGTELFNALCDWFRSSGVEDFGIIAAKTQTAAVQFYDRRGAVKVGEMRLGGLDSIRFHYALPPAV